MIFKKAEVRTIPGLTGYIANNFGQIISLKCGQGSRKKGLLLKPYLSPKGYLLVNLTSNGIQKTYYVHELIALAFLGSRPVGSLIHHKDEIKINNQPENIGYIPIATHIRIHKPNSKERRKNNVITTRSGE